MTLAVGFFDGIHCGHRRILAGADAVLTFRNHPAAVFAPDRVPPLLTTSAVRLAELADIFGENRVNALDFTPAIAAQSPEAFADWLRRAYPDLGEILCGPNWTFGAGGAGNPALLRSLGFAVTEIPYAEYGGRPVSSTRIRAAIAAGDLSSATAMLGRAWTVRGALRSGKHIGTALGFPTLNLSPPAGLVQPPHGAYAVDTPLGRGVANYGLAPTMGEKAWKDPVLEVHLLESPSAPVTDSLAVSFLSFLRPERTFPSQDALAEQIARDAEAARSFKTIPNP